MSGKEVLVEDKLFSTLETTVGRLAASPRVLLADTIGFIDNLPNATLDAFRATLAEALECDMLLLLVDATDELSEFERKLSATRREINTRYLSEDQAEEIMSERKIMCVLTKIESLKPQELAEKEAMVIDCGYGRPMAISVHQDIGIDELQDEMLAMLFGQPATLSLNQEDTGRDIEGYVADVYDAAMVIDKSVGLQGSITMQVWISEQSLARLIANSNGRIGVK